MLKKFLLRYHRKGQWINKWSLDSELEKQKTQMWGLRAEFRLKVWNLSWGRSLRQAIFWRNLVFFEGLGDTKLFLKGKGNGEGEDRPTYQKRTPRKNLGS